MTDGMQTCPRCAMEVPAAAYVCGHCRKKLRTTPATWGCVAVLGIFLLAAVIPTMLVSPRRPSEPEPSPPTVPARPVPDAAARRKILSGLKANRDEFQKCTFYKHRDTPVLGSQIYLYIAECEHSYGLRLVAIYQGDNWIFWNKLHTKVGDRVVTLDPGTFEVKRDNGSGSVWESLDIDVASGAPGVDTMNFNATAAPTLTLLTGAASASMRFAGDKVDDRKISPGELARFKDVQRKYMALFGIN